MTNRLYDLAVERRASPWATFYQSFDALLQQRPTRPATLITGDEPPLLRAHATHDVQSVPIYKIVTVAPRFGMFDAWLRPNAPELLADSTTDSPASNFQNGIELYQVGNMYIVKDGNQRVAQARLRGQVFIPASVVEYVYDLPHNERGQLYELLLHEEQRTFFETTKLTQVRPEQPIVCSILGNYQLLQGQIDAYRSNAATPLSAAESVMGWHDHVYAPLISHIRKQRFNVYFPKQHETDLYLWATERAAREHHNAARVSRFAVLKQLATLRRALRRAHIFSEAPKH